ncbi:hypothetical protein [Xylanibacter muris]|uniref:NfeD-like C-terminal domain-containing protein n=1 Tax=Xylanibacter muris TaxID=2736290 RepID=A0ABX2AIP0_9BACT|nr:hypothetical protein [Xylanibacter muris]NPD90916.1 hypothetical protein [Xylanibacter muris]
MDTSRIFLIIALVSTGVFLLQFVISIFFGDVDVDVDSDASADTDVSSVFSFKGLIHFLIGFGWTRFLIQGASWVSYIGAFLVGIVFVFILWYLYILAFRLQKIRKPENANQLVGRSGYIYANRGNGNYIIHTERDGAIRELDVVSGSGKKDYATNEKVTIEGYKNNTYYIG